jgi:hypothetical protein
MLLGLVMAVAVNGSPQMSTDGKLDNALGELAFTIGACTRALPKAEADPVVLALTGADQTDPTADQTRNRNIFSGLFKEGRASANAEDLSAPECIRMIGDLTVALRHAAAKQSDL